MHIIWDKVTCTIMVFKTITVILQLISGVENTIQLAQLVKSFVVK
jgi:hypothetical protein